MPVRGGDTGQARGPRPFYIVSVGSGGETGARKGGRCTRNGGCIKGSGDCITDSAVRWRGHRGASWGDLSGVADAGEGAGSGGGGAGEGAGAVTAQAGADGPSVGPPSGPLQASECRCGGICGIVRVPGGAGGTIPRGDAGANRSGGGAEGVDGCITGSGGGTGKRPTRKYGSTEDRQELGRGGAPAPPHDGFGGYGRHGSTETRTGD